MEFLKSATKWKIALTVFAIIGIPGSIVNLQEGYSVGQVAVGLIIYLLIFSAPLILEFIYFKTPAETIWKRWKDVEGIKSSERKERAVNGEVTPIHVYPNAKVAFFAGSQKGHYRTTLKNCSCPDFQKRKVPCKHMYYLAIKCNVEN